MAIWTSPTKGKPNASIHESCRTIGRMSAAGVPSSFRAGHNSTPTADHVRRTTPPT
jgi:hypothetical protein